jgi:hypothetical protein
MFDGKTLKHLKPDEVEDYRAAILRGRQLKQIDRQIEKLQQRLEQLIATTTNTTRQTSPPTPLLQGEGSNTPPFPSREGGLGGLGLSAPGSIESTTAFTDLTEQERLVKEVLAKSQELRTSLKKSADLSLRLRSGIVNVRNGHPHLQ